jgi:hypothetical protein
LRLVSTHCSRDSLVVLRSPLLPKLGYWAIYNYFSPIHRPLIVEWPSPPSPSPSSTEHRQRYPLVTFVAWNESEPDPTTTHRLLYTTAPVCRVGKSSCALVILQPPEFSQPGFDYGLCPPPFSPPAFLEDDGLCLNEAHGLPQAGLRDIDPACLTIPCQNPPHLINLSPRALSHEPLVLNRVVEPPRLAEEGGRRDEQWHSYSNPRRARRLPRACHLLVEMFTHPTARRRRRRRRRTITAESLKGPEENVRHSRPLPIQVQIIQMVPSAQWVQRWPTGLSSLVERGLNQNLGCAFSHCLDDDDPNY